MDPPAYVCRADDDVVEVKAADDEAIGTLTQLGFEPHADQAGLLVLTVHDDEDKAEVFAALRDARVGFSWGREWNPVEVYQWLCEKGLLEGPFRTIGWTRPGEFHIRDMA